MEVVAGRTTTFRPGRPIRPRGQIWAVEMDDAPVLSGNHILSFKTSKMLYIPAACVKHWGGRICEGAGGCNRKS
jgi:hypothetical protein